MPKETKLYDILGVDPSANGATIKKAYFKLAQKYNPNIPENKEKFQEISNAYEILKDEEKRRLYDAYGEEGMKNPMVSGGGFSPFDMFFGGGGGRQQRGPKQTDPIGKEVAVSLTQMFNGDDIKVTVNRTTKCPKCNGEGSEEPGNITICTRCNGNGVVMITSRQGNTIFQQQGHCPDCKGKGEKIKDPSKICKSCRGNRLVSETKTLNVHLEPGTPDKHQQIVHSEGNWEPGKLQGDLIIIFKQKKDDVFRREEADLFMEKSISLEEALCGTSFTISHPSGEKITIFREAGKPINHGDILSVKSLGMPIFGRIYEHGNLFINFKVQFPKNLSAEIRTQIVNLIGTEDTKKRITDCATLKENGVSICKLQYIDPKQRTKNDTNTRGQAEYGDNEDMQEHGQQVQCGGM